MIVYCLFYLTKLARLIFILTQFWLYSTFQTTMQPNTLHRASLKENYKTVVNNCNNNITK